MKNNWIMLCGLLFSMLVISGCITTPPANLVSWDGKLGKVRQAMWGPLYEKKVDPEMDKLMQVKCPNGFSVTKVGSDIVGGGLGPAEARFKEFQCK